jgi:hypothetical protein
LSSNLRSVQPEVSLIPKPSAPKMDAAAGLKDELTTKMAALGKKLDAAKDFIEMGDRFDSSGPFRRRAIATIRTFPD